MTVAFQNWLWLLAAIPAVAAVVYLARTSRCSLATWRFTASLVARLSMIAMLIAALAGLMIVRTRDELGVFFVVDFSKSIGPEEQKFAIDWVSEAVKALNPKRDRAGLIIFGAGPAVDQPLDRVLDPRKITAVINRDFTDLSQAIRLAVASFPSDAQKRMVVITDGEENLGDGLEAAREARAAGVDVWIRGLRSLRGRDLAIHKISIPGEAKLGEAFDVLVHTRFTGAAPGEVRPATLRLWRNRRLVGSFDIEAGAGEDVFRIPQKILAEDGAGGYEYEASVEAADDPIGENNRAFGYTRVQGESRVLLVEGKEGESRELESALRSGGITNLARISPAQFPATMSELLNFDAVLLDNAAAHEFIPGETGQLALMKDYVESHGGGLVMIGGDHSFGSGGYFRTAVEEALPVSMDIRKRKMRASMALIIAIDRSGSMSMTVPGGQTKLSLANESACRVIEMLDAKDQVGVCFIDTNPKWAVELQHATDSARPAMIDDVRSTRGGGGGIYVYTALEAAYQALDKADAMIRHVILFSDAADSEQPDHCVDRAHKELLAGRTLTVIGMGKETDQDGAFLKDLARAGDGRIVFVEDVRTLPEIFTAETITASKSAIVETDFQPGVTGASPLIEGIDWAKSPMLHGYVTSTIKPRAEMILRATEEDPLLAKWQFGLGRSVAFASDATSRWSRDWLGWDGYRRLWPQVVRWVSRRRAETDYRMDLQFAQGKGRIVLDAFDTKGEAKNFLELSAHLSGPDGRPVTVKLAQKAGGRYEGEFPTPVSGAYFATVADKGGTIVGQSGGAVSYPAEYRAPDTRSTLIDDVARIPGGRALTLPQGVFEHTAEPAKSRQEIGTLLLALALALMLLDVVMRRVAIPDFFALIVAKLKPRRAAPEAEAAQNTMLERLKSAKAAVADELKPAVPSEAMEKLLREAPAPSESAPAAPAAASPPPAPTAPAPDGTLQRLLDAKRKAGRGPDAR